MSRGTEGKDRPDVDEAVMLARHDVAHEALVVLLLSQRLEGPHQHVVVSQEGTQEEATEAVAEARVARGIQGHHLDWDAESLPRLGRQTRTQQQRRRRRRLPHASLREGDPEAAMIPR